MRPLELFIVAPVALFFAGMGVISLLDPQYTVSFFGAPELGADMRNEVRAVYGGFGLALGGLLLATFRYPAISKGARIGVIAALLGMAGGRLLSFSLEATTSLFPALFLALEIIMAFMLFLSLKTSHKGDTDVR